MGSSEKTILTYFHPDAVELFNVTSNLRRVCEELKGDPAIRLNPQGASLFQPVKPMLASRAYPEGVMKIMGDRPFTVETKFDGERVQVHKDGNTIKLYSRNSNDITPIYGPTLIPTLLECISVTKCIVDGELLVWDSIAGRFEDFGKLKTFAQFERERASGTLSSQPNIDLGANLGKQYCYMAFDLLFVNNKSVLSLTLEQRMGLLTRCIKPKEKVVEVVQPKPVKSLDELIDALDTAIINREEGIMIKDTQSTYIPNERGNKWIKIKPEYIEGVGDDLDLIILGGYYGTGLGRRGGTISHFMLGVVAERDEQVGSTSYGQPTMFYSFCKVGSGYTDNELRVIQKMLEKHWKPFNPQNPPRCFQLQDLKEKPDVWIEPRHSKILQVKAAQMVVSEKYKAGYTLRFPRVVQLRVDKNWNDCLDLSGLVKLAKDMEGRFSKRKYGDAKDGETPTKKRKRTISTKSKGPTVGKQFQDTDVRNVQIKTTLFEGLEFCIMSGAEEHSKSDIELTIHQYGGRKVQYPSPATFCVLVERETLKVKNLIQCGFCDIVHTKWMFDCLQANKRLPLEPKYMIYTRPETRREFLREIDRFGDSFTKDATIESLKEVFKQVDKEKDNANKSQPALVEIKFRGKGTTKEPKEKRRKKEETPEDKEGIEVVLEKVDTREAGQVILQRRVVTDLKDFLKERKLKISGRKDELIQRILDTKFAPVVKEEGEEKKEDMDAETDDGEEKEKEEKKKDKGKEKVKDGDGEEAMEAKMEVVDEKEKRLTEGDLISLELRHFTESKPWWGLFRSFIVYYDRYDVVGDPSTRIELSGLDVAATIFQFYGGKIAETIDDSVSHIVLDPTDLSRLSDIRKSVNRLLHVNSRFAKHVVTKDWVEESAAAHEDLDEREFYILGEQYHQEEQDAFS